MNSTAIAPNAPSLAVDPPSGPGPSLEAGPALAAAARPRPLFSSSADQDDGLGRAEAAGFLAGVVAHPDAGTPFALALTGPAGSGKSAFLDRLLDTLERPADGSAVPGIVVVRADFGAGADPGPSIMARTFAAVAARYPDLAEDALYAGADPLEAAQAANERVNDIRRKLDTERQALDDLGGRRARLAETVLFEAPGSRVDAYARANRARIESRLRAFGLASGDPVATYKDLVREAAEPRGGRGGLVGRAFTGFKGQGTLLGLAVVLLVVGAVCAVLAANADGLEASLAGAGDRFGSITGWLRGHLDGLAPLSRIAFALAVLLLLANAVRAFRFSQPVLRGAALLKSDLEGRGRDLDGLVAHQTRRVDHLAAEVESAVRTADSAERRAEARRSAGSHAPALALAGAEFGQGPDAKIEAFFRGLSSAMDRSAAPAPVVVAVEAAPAAAAAAKPSRIVIAIDELDALPSAQAARALEAAHRLLARPGFVTIVAAERGHLAAGLAETDPALAAAKLDRLFQLSFDVGALPLSATDLAQALLGSGQPRSGSGAPARPPALDVPLRPFEHDLIRSLAPFAGASPRGIRRFVDTYRVARADPRLQDPTAAELGALAWGLALDGGSGALAVGSFDQGSAGAADIPAPSEAGRALAEAHRAVGSTFGPVEGRRGLDVARTFSRRA